MTDEMSPIFRSIDYLKSVETYVPGLLVSEVVNRLGIPAEKVVKLASAENPLGPSPRAIEAIRSVLGNLHLYPDWRAQNLREAIAKYHGALPEQIIIGAGETELISLIFRTFSEQGDEILFPIPTFPIYEQAALVERRVPTSVSMDETTLRVDPERLLQAVTEKTRILILTSPNNPLSTTIERETLNFILEKIPHNVVVLLDEAYVDYSEYGSMVDLVSQHANLVILRTFSKVYGLAGLRVGYGVAHEVIITALMKTKPTWNIGSLAAVGAIGALEDREHYNKTRKIIQEGRNYLIEQLSDFSDISIIMKPQANFLCLRILDSSITSTELFERLLERGVIIKDCSVSYKGLGDRHIRVDISLKSKMDLFLERLSEVLS